MIPHPSQALPPLVTDETLFYRDERLRVSSKRITVEGMEFPLDQVTGVERSLDDPPKIWITIALAVAGLSSGMYSLSKGHQTSSLLLLILGFGAIFWILTHRRFHTVSLVKPHKTVPVLVSDDEELAQSVATAIGEALQARK